MANNEASEYNEYITNNEDKIKDKNYQKLKRQLSFLKKDGMKKENKKPMPLFWQIVVVVGVSYALACALATPVLEEFEDIFIITEYGTPEWLAFWMAVIAIVVTLILNYSVNDLTDKYRDFDHAKENHLLLTEWASAFNFDEFRVTQLSDELANVSMFPHNLWKTENLKCLICLQFSSPKIVPPHTIFEPTDILIETTPFNDCSHKYISCDINFIKLEDFKKEVSSGTENKILYYIYTKGNRTYVEFYFFVTTMSIEENKDLTLCLNDLISVGKTQEHICSAKIKVNGKIYSKIFDMSYGIKKNSDENDFDSDSKSREQKLIENGSKEYISLNCTANVVTPTLDDPKPAYFEICKIEYDQL